MQGKALLMETSPSLSQGGGARVWSIFLGNEMNSFVYQQLLYLLRFSLIFLDVACDEEAYIASRKTPNRFAVYLRKFKNIE